MPENQQFMGPGKGLSQSPPLAAAPTLRVTCYGTRGSVPSPGASTARFGGNTSCLEVCTPSGRRLILDGGTGIRLLGEKLTAGTQPMEADLFLTHFHWDHIQGIPFFAPLYNPESLIRVHGANQGEQDIQSLFAGQMGPVYFPIPFEAISAQMQFDALNGDPWVRDDIEVHSLRVRHPAHTLGYRINAHDTSVAYVPDNELKGGQYPVDDGFYARIVEFLQGTDILFHDAMFTEGEYTRRAGWGHSTFAQAIKLAEDAGVGRLHLFHHAPERTDSDLVRILDELRADLESRGSTLVLDMAAEGEELFVEEHST
jgi:phosphoribosyl 1,2-cyclic phosphodiesterase